MSNVDKLKYNGVEYDLGKSIDASLTQSGQAADAKSVGDVIASQNTNIDAIKERTDSVEDDITTLQTDKVDKTTPLLNFDDTATDPLTDDGALANALTALGILSDVIPSGGGALYLKKALTELAQQITPVRTEFTPTSGTADTSAGKCYYEVIGRLVHVHVALTGLTVNTQLALYTLPVGVRPRHRMTTIGVCGHITYRSYITLQTSGALAVYSQEDNTMCDIFYTL